MALIDLFDHVIFGITVMNVDFARPNVSDLVFHLYGRSVHPELFEIYTESAIRRKAFEARVRICNAGHVIEFRRGGNTITEVTTTRKQPLPKKKRFLENRLRGNRDDAFHFECGIRYQVSYQLERLDREVFLNFHEELLMDCSRAETAHCFPAGTRLAPGPISLVQTDVCADSLLIHAFHTFPESYAVVKTQSLFEI